MYPDYLMHHGVKGMKWGVRKKYYDQHGNLTKKGAKRQKRLDSVKATLGQNVKNAQSNVNYYNKRLNDLKKNGSKSKMFKDWFDDYDKNYHKELLSHLIDSNTEARDYAATGLKSAQKALKNISDLKIDDPEFKKKLNSARYG